MILFIQQPVLCFLNLGGGEVFVILMAILVMFGSKQIPELARGVGKGMRELKDAMAGVESEIKNEINKSEIEIKKDFKSVETDITSSAPAEKKPTE